MVIFLEDGNIDMKKLEIEDVIDIATLQEFQDNYAIGMNCASVTVDREGKPITEPSSYTKFCACYVHGSEIGDARCAASHNKMGMEARKNGKPFIGPCHAGLIDFAAPVIVNGELLGTVLGGQVLNKKTVESQCRQVAKEIGVDEELLLEAANEIEIVKDVNINAAAEVLSIVVNSLASNGFHKIELESVSADLVENFIKVSKSLEELAEASQEITEHQHSLGMKIENVAEVTDEISQVLSSITKVADKTKMIGLNASIEAARLGTAGKGFSVVAMEIRSLAESSKKTAEKINALNNQIRGNVKTTKENAEITLHVTENQSANMKEVTAMIEQMLGIAEKLKKLMD